ncbi:MAG: tetratricopeptide repeat protein [Vicinamibacterales bacterium]
MKRALIVMALLAVAAVGGAVVYQAAARERDYRQRLAHGDTALANHQTIGAIEDYSGAIALRPDSMLAHLRRGETYLLRGDLEGAGRDFRTAAALDSTATRPLELWGEVLYRQQRFRRAAEVFESRLRLDDRSADTYYRLGLARYRDGAPDSAVTALQQALRLDPTLAEAFYVIGLSQREQGRVQAAQSAFESAIAAAPGLIAAREELADVYAATGKRDEEIQQLQVLAGLDGGRLERRIAVGLAHARAGHSDLAVLTLAGTLEQAPDQLATYAALGRVWLDMAEAQRGRPDALPKALEALEKAASAAAATSETKTLYGRALLLSRQPEAAERVLQQATERSPADPEAFALYARVAESQRHYDVARNSLIAYSALVGEDAGFADRAVRIGSLSLRLSDWPAAVSWYERASRSTTTGIAPLLGLAEAHWSAGEREAAALAVARGLQVEPSNQKLLALKRRLAVRP